VLEVTFNAFPTVREFGLGQDYRADHLMAGNLRSQKHLPVRKLSVGKFHEVSGGTHIGPFILHLFDPGLVSHAGGAPGLGRSAAVLPAMRVERQARQIALFPGAMRRLTGRIECRLIVDAQQQSLHRSAE
jgi:hypothetical protein